MFRLSLMMMAFFPILIIITSALYSKNNNYSFFFTFCSLFTCELVNGKSNKLIRAFYHLSFFSFFLGILLLANTIELLVPKYAILCKLSLYFAAFLSFFATLIYSHKSKNHSKIHNFLSFGFFSFLTQFNIVVGLSSSFQPSLYHSVFSIIILPVLVKLLIVTKDKIKYKTLLVLIHKVHLFSLFAVIFSFVLISI